jgi:hypothetical protein
MIMDRFKDLYEFYRQKTPEVKFASEQEIVSYLGNLEFIASGMEALVFIHSDGENVVRLDLYSLSKEMLLLLIKILREKYKNDDKQEYFDDLQTIIGGAEGLYDHLNESADQRLRKKAKDYNDLYKRKPNYSIPCRALLTISNKAVALVLPFIDGVIMTEAEAEAFESDNNNMTNDGNPENYRKNVTTWKNDKVRLDP